MKSFMRGRCKNAIALLLAQAGFAAERMSALFDFGFSDTSLEGATNSPRTDARLTKGVCAQQVPNLIRNTKIVVRNADTRHMRRKSDKLRSRASDGLFRGNLLAQGRGVF